MESIPALPITPRNIVSTPAVFSPEHLAILEQEYPRFSDSEIARRRDAVEVLMRESDVDHLLVHGIAGRGARWAGWRNGRSPMRRISS